MPRIRSGEDEVDERDAGGVRAALGRHALARAAGPPRMAMKSTLRPSATKTSGEDEDGHAERQMTRWGGRPPLDGSSPPPCREAQDGGRDGAEVGELGRLGLARARRSSARPRSATRPPAGASSGCRSVDEDVDRRRPPPAGAPAARRRAAAARCARAGGGARRRVGGTIRLIVPCSSSSSRKTMPFAVPGRWRATTRPPTRTRVPCASVSRSRQDDGARRAAAGAAARSGARRASGPVVA